MLHEQYMGFRRNFFEQKKLVSNDSEMSNSLRNAKKKIGGRFYISYVKFMSRYDFSLFLPMF